ncbi:MAG: mechanosensitive ion channel [Candidatus Lokiarchaeota archaeon]|nr:mechanosensitive ion channel [Candidatus Lokiarchaeota archaeon]
MVKILQFDPYQDFVNFIAVLLEPIGLDQYAHFIAIVPFLITLYIAYLIIARSIRISFKKAGFPREAITGVIFMVRLVFFGIALIAGLAVTNLIAGEGVIAFGALTGTAVGLAFSRSLSNLVSGLYVFASRPFRVGDYIRLGSKEGIVQDITLNYTRIRRPDATIELIPNSDIVESKLVNFRVRADEYLEQERPERTTGYFRTAMKTLKGFTTGEEVYRYTFEIRIHRLGDAISAKQRLEEVVEKWHDKFLAPPEMYYSSNDYNGIAFGFGIIVRNAVDIMNEGTDFQAELAVAVHG